MKGYLVIDDISLEEAKKLMKELKKKGRWITEDAMKRLDSAAAFAMLTHGFPKVEKEEIYEFTEKGLLKRKYSDEVRI